MIIMVSSLVMAADQAGEHTAATSFHREREERGSVSNETSASWWHSINTGQRGVTASISARNSTLRSQFKFTSSDHFLSIKFYDVLCRLAVILQSFSSTITSHCVWWWDPGKVCPVQLFKLLHWNTEKTLWSSSADLQPAGVVGLFQPEPNITQRIYIFTTCPSLTTTLESHFDTNGGSQWKFAFSLNRQLVDSGTGSYEDKSPDPPWVK